MPTLDWIGKEKVINHHHNVPFRVLEHKYGFRADNSEDKSETHSGNKIIHGDNLEALKALLPEYEGKIDCIYIDPPYNTGNEGWVYNDNVNDPHIKKWLGEVVGAEGEDFSRHDKWLCMMYPRLKLLHQLLASDGIIAVSINDQELFNLGYIMNEIFGVSNRLACAPWKAEPSGGKDKTALRTGHEYVLIYSKGDTKNLVKEEKSTGKLDKKDKWGRFRKGRELRKWGATSDRKDRENLWFEIKAPNGEFVVPIKNDGTEGYWRWGKTHPIMKQILENPEYAYWEVCPYDKDVVVDGKTERLVPFEKIREEKRSFGWNTWLDSYGTNSDATKEIKTIFGSKIFDTPKPVSLVEWLISLHGDEDGIVLDSFAGSGVTGHAVLALNKRENTNRKFILIELEDYAESITAERMKRVMIGSEQIPSLGGAFDYYELGAPLFNEDDTLNEEVGEKRIREYIYYTETREYLTREQSEEYPYLLDYHDGTGYFFYYKKNELTTLSHDTLNIVPEKADYYVIYADTCTISREQLAKMNISFKKIPRDINRF